MFGLDPFCGAVFVFRSKRADRIKLLVWDQTGMVLFHKRLEGGKFVWPQELDGVMQMSSVQLAALFDGLDWRLVRPEPARRPLVAGHGAGAYARACRAWRAPDRAADCVDHRVKVRQPPAVLPPGGDSPLPGGF